MAFHTRSAGTLKVRSTTTGASAGLVLSLIADMLLLLMNFFSFSLGCFWAGSFQLLLFELMQIGVKAVKTLLPELAIVLHPFMHFLESGGLQAARTPLRFASVGDQSGTLQHFQVLGNGGHAHIEWFGQFGD